MTCKWITTARGWLLARRIELSRFLMLVLSQDSRPCRRILQDTTDLSGRCVASCGSTHLSEAKIRQQVAWAHPKFGSILASCSYDRKVSRCCNCLANQSILILIQVCVWKEFQPRQWSKVYEYARHASSVSTCAFMWLCSDIDATRRR